MPDRSQGDGSMFKVGDWVSYIGDDRVGQVVEVRNYKFSPDLPYLRVAYGPKGIIFECHEKAFTAVEGSPCGGTG